MNSGYEETLDMNFKRALDLCSGSFSRKDLFEFLKNGNMPEKQFAALEIDTIDNEEEAEILVSNLTGCDGKIRESVAFKLSELLPDKAVLFVKFPEIFADATIDINANICRMIIDLLSSFKDNEEFANKYLSKMFDCIDVALETLDSFSFRDKKYTINKQLFKIYWCLEGINVFYNYVDEKVLFQLLNKCAEIDEYTIREKVALVLKNEIKTKELYDLRWKLKLDSNYYVKNV